MSNFIDTDKIFEEKNVDDSIAMSYKLTNGKQVEITNWERYKPIFKSNTYLSFNASDEESIHYCCYAENKIYTIEEDNILSFLEMNQSGTFVFFDTLKFFRLFENNLKFKDIMSKILTKAVGLNFIRDLVYIYQGKEISKQSLESLMSQAPKYSALVTSSNDLQSSKSKSMSQCLYLHDLHMKLMKNINVNYKDLNRSYGTLTQNLQVKASIALNAIQTKGVNLDQEEIKSQVAIVRVKLDQVWLNLEQFNILRTTKYESLIRSYLKDSTSMVNFKLNKNNQIVVSKDNIKLICNQPNISETQREVFQSFATIYDLTQIEGFLWSLVNKDKSYPEYATLKSTGRASAFKGKHGVNIQSIGKKTKPILEGFPELDLRKIFIPDDSFVFLQVDYSTIELCSLAQICLKRFGKSKLADLINAGEDLHTLVAANIFNKVKSEVTKEERSLIKIVNYGLPGGMGAQSLYENLSEFDPTITLQQTKEIKNSWFSLFPEVKRYLEPDISIYDYYNLKSISTTTDQYKETSNFLEVCQGTKLLESNYKNQVFSLLAKHIKDFSTKSKLYISSQVGNDTLYNEVQKIYSSVTITGRPKGKMNYTQRANSAFQGLVADGMKIALYNLWKEEIIPNAFITDEVLISVPISDTALHNRITQIMIESMKEVIPDIEIKVDAKLLRSWSESSTI